MGSASRQFELNTQPLRADGHVVLYWMQQAQRAEDTPFSKPDTFARVRLARARQFSLKMVWTWSQASWLTIAGCSPG